MKSFFAALLCALVSTLSLKAQFVTIPDTNFVTFLQTNYPGCMSGNQMDTTCPAIITDFLVDVSYKNIADLTGIEYFDALAILNAFSNQLTSTPPLRTGLVNLTVGDNQFVSLPALPPTLQILDVSSNPITIVPPLPSTLTDLYLGNDQITSFPPLPASLNRLDVQNCNLSTLPPLPSGLTSLVCANNPLGIMPSLPPNLESLSMDNVQLTTFPVLPNSIIYLGITHNNLATIPVLPTSLTQLFCSDNQLVTLPALPVNLKYLYCNDNALVALPTLPSTLEDLTCGNNALTALPPLPAGLIRIVAQNNQLASLGTLPAGLTVSNFDNNQITCFAPFPQPNNINLNVTNNPFTCIPNYPNYMNPPLGTTPICTPGNAFGCTNGEGFGGTVYDDANADCIRNGVDPGIQNVPLKVYDNTGLFVQASSSRANGPYFFSQAIGTWTAKIDTAGKPYRVTCSQPGVDSTVVLSLGTPLVQGVDFEVDCKPGFDLGVNGVVLDGLIFPGQPFTAKALAGDLSNFYGLHCATGVAGQVVVNYSGPAAYVGPKPGALTPIVSGFTFTYNIPDFGLVNLNHDFELMFTTATTATAADTMCFDVTVTPTLGDNSPANNSYTMCVPVRNSHDPNAKDVSPMAVGPNYADWLNYTVHFQNTGNAAAINIHVEDTLDTDLDWSSMEMLDASHYYTWNLTANALAVYFPNIMLPDSASDPAASQGWFMYRVKPKANLPLGTTIDNMAAIYFDFNAPVITNTATTSYNLVTGLRDQVNAAAVISVFPNPSAGIFQVEYPAHWKRADWSVTNLMGQELLHQSASSGGFAVDLAAQPAGFYLLRVSDGRSQIVRQLVKR